MAAYALVTTLQQILETLQDGVVHLSSEQSMGVARLGSDALSDCPTRTVTVDERLRAVEEALKSGRRDEHYWLGVALLGDALVELAGEMSDGDGARLTRRIGYLLFHSGHAARGVQPMRETASS